MKDLLSIRQISDVLEYANCFDLAKHKVLVHNKDMGEVFFVQKFLDGLKYVISNVISLHCLRTVDAALSLALMQEEIVEASTRRFSPRSRENSKFPTKIAPQINPSNSLLGTPPVSEKLAQKPRWDDKLQALRSARRAKGLCMKCGETYGPQHKCPPQIALHVMEEVLDMLQLDRRESCSSDAGSQNSYEEILALSYCATVGIQGKKIIRVQGLIQDQEVLILIDSGSSSTFISDTLVQQLKLPTTAIQSVQVTVADGGKLTTKEMVPQLTWWTQGHSFSQDACVLPLKMYDLVLGMDWLEAHSPMWVDWKWKKMGFSYEGRRITLTRVKDCTSQCLPLKPLKLKGLLKRGAVAQLVKLQVVPSTQATARDSFPYLSRAKATATSTQF